MSPAIHFRVSDEERQAAEVAAASQGVALSDFAREALAAAVVAASGRTKDPLAIARHIAKATRFQENIGLDTISDWIRDGVPVKGKSK